MAAMPPRKPYQSIPIQDCGEPLVAIPTPAFVLLQPHPYQTVGAPYDQYNPFFLRQGVLAALHQAQEFLRTIQPAWNLGIFDAYRPVSVQRYMVEYTFKQVLAEQGLEPDQLTETQTQELWQQVYTFWAVPSDDPATPPPHSTGAAIDLTLVDATGQAWDLGSPIDELSPRSFPDHFAQLATQAPPHSPEQTYYLEVDHRRRLLNQAMTTAGFARHPQEWWHFSLGDQLWAWQQQQAHPDQDFIACYGRADLLR